MSEQDPIVRKPNDEVEGRGEDPATTGQTDAVTAAGPDLAEGHAPLDAPVGPMEDRASYVAAVEPAAVELPAVGPVPAEPETSQEVVVDVAPVAFEAAPEASPGAPPPGFLLGSEVARSARLRQPAFDEQLSLLEQQAELKKKIYLAVIVIASVFVAGMIAGAVLGIFV